MERGTLAAVLAAVALPIGGFATRADASPAGPASSHPAAVASPGATQVRRIYSSLPLRGRLATQARAAQAGIRLALKQAGSTAGGIPLDYVALDDSTKTSGTWDPAQAAANARRAAMDAGAIAYIGEFNSGASAIAIPILNQAGLGQISPSNTYPGLTTGGPATEPGEPTKYYPTGRRTYARIAPNDVAQAAALVALLKGDGCTRVAVATDRDTYGAGLGRLLSAKAKRQGLRLAVAAPGTSAAAVRSYAARVRASGADCFLYSGITTPAAVAIVKRVGARVPGARLYGADGVCETAFTNPRRGIPKSLASRFRCTVAALAIEATPGGAQFLEAFRTEYHVADPDPYAIYGYAAAQLVLATIDAGGTTKEEFIRRLFQTRNTPSVLGPFSITRDGDTTLADFGVYRVGDHGAPVFERTVRGTPGSG